MVISDIKKIVKFFPGSWWRTAIRSIFILESKILLTMLETKQPMKFKMNIVAAVPGVAFHNDDGIMTGVVQGDMKVYMNTIYPTYSGELTNVQIKSCHMLSYSASKTRDETYQRLEAFTLPPVHVHNGYNHATVHKSKFHQYMRPSATRLEVTCGFLEIFEELANSPTPGWFIVMEDDVRLVNINKTTDLTLLDIPADADFVALSRSSCRDEFDARNVAYVKTFSGGNNQMFLLSSLACQKVLHYVTHYGWRGAADDDLYALTDCKPFLSPYGNMQYKEIFAKIVSRNHTDCHLNMYALNYFIANQTSCPDNNQPLE